MRTRKKCQTKGHKFATLEGVILPIEFCRRWRCDAERVADWVPEPLATEMRKVTNT